MRFFASSVLICFSVVLLADISSADTNKYEKCLIDEMKKADGKTRVEDIRLRCASCESQENTYKNDSADLPGNEKSIISRRLEKEYETADSPFILTAHRPNYIMPYTYNPSRNNVPFNIDRDEFDNEEIKFQISLKYLLLDKIFRGDGDLYMAYTNQSYWQAYNTDASSPFRETNHEPEAWLHFTTGYEIAGLTLGHVSAGISHQSNGRGVENISRSWNRVFMNFVFERGCWVLSLKPWYRIPEEEEDDNNPSIEKYVGYGEIRTACKWNDNVFSMMFRNNFRQSENMGAVEIGWSFPVYRKIRGYVQHFNGYCESLIDYDSSTNRFGAGIMLSDAL